MESSALSLSFLLKCVFFGALDNAGNWGFKGVDLVIIIIIKSI